MNIQKVDLSLLESENNRSGAIALLGLDNIFVSDDGRFFMSVEIEDKHLNAIGIVHGGIMYTICDQTVAAYDICLGRKAVGMDGSMHYYRPAHKGDILTSYLTDRKVGHRTTVHMVELRNQENVLIADAMYTSMYLD